MESTHRLRVPAPLEEVWSALGDPARIAAVLPGSLVDEAADDTFAGTWKIKLGSSLLALAGTGRYVSSDADEHRLVVQTTGSDRRGDAGVEATHTLVLTAAEDGAPETDVTVESAMTWSGRPARLGDGVVADAVGRVLEQAGSRIAARVAEGLPWVPPVDDATATDDELTAEAVLDHPAELGADVGSVDAATAGAGGRPSPSPAPGPAPRTPAPAEPAEYVWKPFTTTAEPHVESVRTFGRVVVRRVLPYAGLGALAAFGLAKAVRRARR